VLVLQSMGYPAAVGRAPILREGILRLCASCTRIRDEKDERVQLESYVSRHISAEFSRGIFPECVKKPGSGFTGNAPPRDPRPG
jgi:hypothetical protein